MLRENICSTYFFISGLTRQPLRDSRYVIALKIKMIKILPVTVKERETKRKVWLVFALNQMWANWATLGNQQIFWFNKSYVLKQLENRSPRCIPFHFISCKKNIFDKNKRETFEVCILTHLRALWIFHPLIPLQSWKQNKYSFQYFNSSLKVCTSLSQVNKRFSVLMYNWQSVICHF